MKIKHELLRDLIDDSGKTRLEVAEECGIKLDTLYRIMAGSRDPSRAIVILLANCLDTSVDNLEDFPSSFFASMRGERTQ